MARVKQTARPSARGRPPHHGKTLIPSIHRRRLQKCTKRHQTDLVAFEREDEGIEAFHHQTAHDPDRETELEIKRRVVDPRPRYVAHCPVSFPSAPFEKIHRHNLQQSIQLRPGIDPRERSRNRVERPESLYLASDKEPHSGFVSPCSPLRWYDCEHLFFQEYLWANRFNSSLDSTGRPYSLLLQTMKKVVNLITETEMCLEGLPEELVQFLLSLLVKEGRLNTSSFISCLSSRCLTELDMSQWRAIQPSRPNRLKEGLVPLPISDVAWPRVPQFLSETLTSLSFGEIDMFPNTIADVLSGCTNLQRLHLWGGPTSATSPSPFQSMVNMIHLKERLVYLSLDEFSFPPVEPLFHGSPKSLLAEFIAQCTQLRHFRLINSKCPMIHFQNESLEIFELKGVSVTQSISQDFNNNLVGTLTFALPQLVKFVFSGRPSKPIGKRFLTGLQTLANSKNLSIFKLMHVRASYAQLKFIKTLQNLQHFACATQRPTIGLASHVAKHCRQLVSLTCSSVGSCDRVQYLSLYAPQLQRLRTVPQVLRQLEEPFSFPMLQELDLRNSSASCTDKELQFVLLGAPSLKRLRLPFCIASEGSVSFSQVFDTSIEMPQLEYLEIHLVNMATKIEAVAQYFLGIAPGLRWLYVAASRYPAARGGKYYPYSQCLEGKVKSEVSPFDEDPAWASTDNDLLASTAPDLTLLLPPPVQEFGIKAHKLEDVALRGGSVSPTFLSGLFANCPSIQSFAAFSISVDNPQENQPMKPENLVLHLNAPALYHLTLVNSEVLLSTTSRTPHLRCPNLRYLDIHFDLLATLQNSKLDLGESLKECQSLFKLRMVLQLRSAAAFWSTFTAPYYLEELQLYTDASVVTSQVLATFSTNCGGSLRRVTGRCIGDVHPKLSETLIPLHGFQALEHLDLSTMAVGFSTMQEVVETSSSLKTLCISQWSSLGKRLLVIASKSLHELALPTIIPTSRSIELKLECPVLRALDMSTQMSIDLSSLPSLQYLSIIPREKPAIKSLTLPFGFHPSSLTNPRPRLKWLVAEGHPHLRNIIVTPYRVESEEKEKEKGKGKDEEKLEEGKEEDPERKLSLPLEGLDISVTSISLGNLQTFAKLPFLRTLSYQHHTYASQALCLGESFDTAWQPAVKDLTAFFAEESKSHCGSLQRDKQRLWPKGLLWLPSLEMLDLHGSRIDRFILFEQASPHLRVLLAQDTGLKVVDTLKSQGYPVTGLVPIKPMTELSIRCEIPLDLFSFRAVNIDLLELRVYWKTKLGLPSQHSGSDNADASFTDWLKEMACRCRKLSLKNGKNEELSIPPSPSDERPLAPCIEALYLGGKFKRVAIQFSSLKLFVAKGLGGACESLSVDCPNLELYSLDSASNLDKLLIRSNRLMGRLKKGKKESSMHYKQDDVLVLNNLKELFIQSNESALVLPQVTGRHLSCRLEDCRYLRSIALDKTPINSAELATIVMVLQESLEELYIRQNDRIAKLELPLPRLQILTIMECSVLQALVLDTPMLSRLILKTLGRLSAIRLITEAPSVIRFEAPSVPSLPKRTLMHLVQKFPEIRMLDVSRCAVNLEALCEIVKLLPNILVLKADDIGWVLEDEELGLEKMVTEENCKQRQQENEMEVDDSVTRVPHPCLLESPPLIVLHLSRYFGTIDRLTLNCPRLEVLKLPETDVAANVKEEIARHKIRQVDYARDH